MLLRRITQHVKAQNWVAVALDFLIVVAGILIAFQITNWSESRREEAALESYLTSISENIAFDLDRAAAVKAKRVDAVGKTSAINWLQQDLAGLDFQIVMRTSEAFANLSEYDYFFADESAFETFKTSGLLRNIQGTDVERLIFRYYNLANEIVLKEADYNQFLKDSFGNLLRQELSGWLYVAVPDLIGGEAGLAAIKPEVQEVVWHPVAIAMYSHTFSSTPELIVRYDNLEILGREIIRIAEDPRSAREASSDAIDNLFEIDGNRGYPKVLLDGALASRFYSFGFAASSDASHKVSNQLNEFKIDAPLAEWSVFYFRNLSQAMIDRPTKDFSQFRAVRVTMKGAEGGEEVFLSMKDSSDPDDGSETRHALTLNAQWTDYEIPLTVFETANLEEIYAPLQFIFLDGAASLSIGEIEFLE